MFTGLIEDIGGIERLDRRGDAAVLCVVPAAMNVAELSPGDSIAIDGVCLTVTEIAPQRGNFTVLAGAETLQRTSLGRLEARARVNLERALRVGDRLGGHLVSGHVDGVGRIARRRDMGSNLTIAIDAPGALLRYVIEKGSVALDGISLTVNGVDGRSLRVALIPHTVEQTTLAHKQVGDEVNIEVDQIGKYIDKLLGGYR